jgi:hypothetical protein
MFIPTSRLKKNKSSSGKKLDVKASGGLISSVADVHVPDSANSEPSTAAAELCSDPTVILYVKQLDDHRKKCELSGRCAYVAADDAVSWRAGKSPSLEQAAWAVAPQGLGRSGCIAARKGACWSLHM